MRQKEKVQPQQNNQANDKITNYNFNNEQEVKPQKTKKHYQFQI